MTEKVRPTVTNIAEVPWQEPPGHYGGALSGDGAQ